MSELKIHYSIRGKYEAKIDSKTKLIEILTTKDTEILEPLGLKVNMTAQSRLSYLALWAIAQKEGKGVYTEEKNQPLPSTTTTSLEDSNQKSDESNESFNIFSGLEL